MIRIILLLFTVISLIVNQAVNCYAISDPKVVANNRFGIHILFPEELEMSAKLVNTSGGDWGYVTIPISSRDKDLQKWQKFMDDTKRFHLIPIIRLATYPVSDYWMKPTIFDPLDWANFLDSLEWPTKNRYIVVYNEPNRAQEWENDLNPEEYAKQLSWTIEALKNVNPDFFILNGGFDAAATTNHILMDEFQYLYRMNNAVPGIFQKIDGWSSHSYPNPNFSGLPTDTHRTSIIGFRREMEFLKNNFGVGEIPVFITETGWQHETLPENLVSDRYQTAFTQMWVDKNLIAITPFLLTAGDGPFKKFSFTNERGEPREVYKKITQIPKIAGNPEKQVESSSDSSSVPSFKNEPESQAQKPSPSFPFWKDIAKWFLHF